MLATFAVFVRLSLGRLPSWISDPGIETHRAKKKPRRPKTTGARRRAGGSPRRPASTARGCRRAGSRWGSARRPRCTAVRRPGGGLARVRAARRGVERAGAGARTRARTHAHMHTSTQAHTQTHTHHFEDQEAREFTERVASAVPLASLYVVCVVWLVCSRSLTTPGQQLHFGLIIKS